MFLRMLRCQVGHDPGDEQTRAATIVSTGVDGAAAAGYGSGAADKRQATLHREPQPSTSQDRHGRRDDAGHHAVMWTRRPNTEEGPDASDSNVIVERY